MDSSTNGAPPGEKENVSDAGSKTGKKLDKLLDRLHDSASRENSPEPSKAKERSGASRRKPKVTRKFTEEPKTTEVEIASADMDSLEGTNSFDYIDSLLGSGRAPSPLPDMEPLPGGPDLEPEPEPVPLENGQDSAATPAVVVTMDDTPTIIEDDKPEAEEFVIPEGTVIVEPEAVDDKKKRPVFSGPEWKSPKKTTRGDALGIITCSACSKQINTNKEGSVKRHPVLQVLICKKCYNWYTSAEIEQDSDGTDEQCRWCGEGGNLICCDFCHNAFCKKCIKRNLGRKMLGEIMDAGDNVKWRCYVCDPKPLAKIIQEATDIIDTVETTLKEAKEKESSKRHSSRPSKPVNKDIPSTTPKSKNDNLKQTARKSTTPQVPSRPGTSPNMGGLQIQNIVQNALANVGIGKGKNVAPQPMYILQNQPGGKTTMQPVGRLLGQGMQISGAVGKQQAPRVQVVPQRHQAGQKAKQSPQQVLKPMARPEWDVNVNEFNVSQVLDRTLAATESMRMVLASFKEELRKGARQGIQQHGASKRDVARKMRRAMGAYKKQIQDIEFFARAFQPPRNQPLQHVVRGGQKQQPTPVSLIKSGTQVKPLAKKSDNSVVVILSDSEDEDEIKTKKGNKAEDGDKDKAESSKKKFQMKLNIGPSSSKSKKDDTDKKKTKADEDLVELSDNDDEEDKSNKKESSVSQESESKDKEEEKEKEDPKKDEDLEEKDSKKDTENKEAEDKTEDVMEIESEDVAEKNETAKEDKSEPEKDDNEQDEENSDPKVQVSDSADNEKSDTDAAKDESESQHEEKMEEDDSSPTKQSEGEEKEDEAEENGGRDNLNSDDSVNESEGEEPKTKATKTKATKTKAVASEEENNDTEVSLREEEEDDEDEESEPKVSDNEFNKILNQVQEVMNSEIYGESSEQEGQSDTANVSGEGVEGPNAPVDSDSIENDITPAQRDQANSDAPNGDSDASKSKDLFESLQFEPLFEIGPMSDSKDKDSPKEGVKRSRSASDADKSEDGVPAKRSKADIEAEKELLKESAEECDNDEGKAQRDEANEISPCTD